MRSRAGPPTLLESTPRCPKGRRPRGGCARESAPEPPPQGQPRPARARGSEAARARVLQVGGAAQREACVSACAGEWVPAGS